jgi:dihydrofolate synthase/folylpolyglutamate synthase
MTAALLDGHGVRAGAYLSPHVRSWRERIVLAGGVIEPAGFVAALRTASEAAARVEGSLAGGERVTQFELITAAAFVALAEAGVEVGVIEAGLGGRLDATNVIESRVTALSSVGLDHTQLLGETEVEIAGEKLDVLREGSTLIVGSLDPEVAALAGRVAAERGARLIEPAAPDPDLAACVRGPYQRRNLAVALACAEALAGPLDPARTRAAIRSLALPGRLELLEGDPPLVVDGAHNPAGARALAEALGELSGRRPIAACLAVLDDKDAAGIARGLAGAIDHAVCAELPVERLRGAGRSEARGLPASRLAEACRGAAIASVEQVSDPGDALERALAWARTHDGLALCAGSHYLLEYAWTVRRAPS